MSEKIISFATATLEAMIEEMTLDQDVFVFGEDIAKQGGIFGQFSGLKDRFPQRVLDTPISETALVGAGVGAALAGSKPIIDLHFADFIGIAMDEILNQMAKIRYMFGGQASLPLVLRAPDGVMAHAAAQHSQSLEQLFISIPGIRVVIPSDPYSAKGLLKAAIRDPEPVIYFENKGLFQLQGPVPTTDYLLALDQAAVVKPGTDITIVSYSLMLTRVLQLAQKIEQTSGICCEVIDLRSIVPLDIKTILTSVQKTKRLIVVHEANKIGGVGAEIAAQISEQAWAQLKAPVLRIGAKFSPIPYSHILAQQVLVSNNAITDAIIKTVNY